jgi:ParB-like chromosome segregation protein Spo0J
MLSAHPVAKLFPSMASADFAALLEDIRLHGVRVPILVHGGQILDGRHRYKACLELGVPCPTVEWDGCDPWIEVQSRNLVRRHLSKDQIYAIRILASRQFPQLMAPIEAARSAASQRKAQAKGQPRGRKALSGARAPKSAADAIGSLLGMSGTTVKRVERLQRVAPEFVPKVAAGELSAKKALAVAGWQAVAASHASAATRARAAARDFVVPVEVRRLQHAIRDEWTRCPIVHRDEFIRGLRRVLADLIDEHDGERAAATLAGPANGALGLVMPTATSRG